MDEDGTEVLPSSQTDQFALVHPEEEIKTDHALSEGGPQIELYFDFNDSEEMELIKKGLLLEKMFLPFQSKSEKVIKGKVDRYNEKLERQGAGLIVLYKQILSVYEGNSKESKLLHQYPFPHGAEYEFDDDWLRIYDENGQFLHLQGIDKQLCYDMYMEWLSKKNIFTDFKKEQAEDNTRDDYDGKNYSLKFNHPSFREIDNIYDKRYMTPFQYYPIVDGQPKIKNAVEFKYFFRPNRLMTSHEQEFDEGIQEHMSNLNRKFIQWAPSRDWSQLIVFSSLPFPDDDRYISFYLEFFDLNHEKQTILPSPLRISFLSQLLRPQSIQNLFTFTESKASQIKFEASFTAQTIVIAIDKTLFSVYQLMADGKIRTQREFNIIDGSIESIKLSCLKLYVKSNGFNYEQFVNYFFNKYDESGNMIPLSLDKDFSKKTNLKNIIKCGIFDILIYDEHIQIFSNISPKNQLDEIQVDDGILQLLKSQNPKQFNNYQIACLAQTLNEEDIQIQIIEVRQDKLVMTDSRKISFKSPWNTLSSDCLFDLIQFREQEYAVLIVTSPSKNEQFLQKYEYSEKNDKYEFAAQKQQNDYINVEQIPHLPLVNINGSKFINCDTWLDNNTYQELDLRLDQQEICNLEKENINSQRVQVYKTNFLQYLFRLVEEQEGRIGPYTLRDSDIKSIEILELRTSIIVKSGGQNSSSGLLIFYHSIDKIKHLKFKQPIQYIDHRVIYLDNSYYVSIIIRLTDYSLNQIRIRFDLTKVTLAPLKLITKLPEKWKSFLLYQHDDFKVSLFITGSDCFFKHLSLNSQGEQEETIKFDFEDGMFLIEIPKLSQFIKRIARSESKQFKQFFLENFQSIIFQNAEELIKKELNNIDVMAFQNKFIFFEFLKNSLTLMDDSFNLIGTLILSSKYGIHTIRIASIDPGALEYFDKYNNKYPFPIWGNLQDYKSNDERLLNNYAKNVGYPMPFQFDQLDGFISHLDLKSEKLFFYKSSQDKKDGNIAARIEVISRKQSFIDDIIESTERKDIEQRMKQIELNLLLSYNVNTRMNLITGTKDHPEKDHIYSVLYKLLEIADIKELPMLIYNTSLDPNKYESIIDVLIENKAIKLAQFIVRIALQQDQIGYIYSRLYQYLHIFSANEIQMFFQNQIFFFKIPEDCYEEYQIVKNTQITPFSDCKTFMEIIKNMKKEKSTVQDIKDPDNQEQKKEKYMQDEKEFTVPTEFYAINLLNLIQSKNQSLGYIHENHKEVTQILNKFVEIDQSIIEKDSFQLIIDFKWDSYVWKFFSIQLALFICFITAFIFDVVAVSRNSHIFSSDDKNQAIPRITSIAILIPFGIYEIADIVVTRKKYFESFWNVNDVLLITLYVTYFTMTFARPEQEGILKSLQLVIVLFSFIKFSFLIRIWTQVSFLVRMLIVVFKELLIFLLFFLLVIGGLTVMAQIIINQSRDQYEGIKLAAYFLIVLRQSIGDYDTTSIVEGTRDFKILAWLLWFLILLIGNVVFMNFIIAVVSESYESCMEKKVRLIYRAKLEMITECEDLMPERLFKKENWFPRFIIIRRQQGSGAEGDNSDEWYGFVKQMQKNLQYETNKQTNKLIEWFIQNMNRSTESTKKEIKAIQYKVSEDATERKFDVSEVKKDVSQVKTGQEKVNKDIAEMKKETAEVKKETAEMKVQINEIKLILSAVFKDQIALMKAQEAEANDNKAI